MATFALNLSFISILICETYLYFPYDRGGSERYLGAKVRLNSRGMYHTSLREQEKDVKIDSLTELLKGESW